MNAIQLLKDDHKKVRGLLADLEATTKRGAKKRSALLEKIATELEVHASIEEEIFYPAFRAAGQKADDEGMYFEALEEHRAAIELVLPDLQRTATDSDQFSGRAKVLKEMIEHHAREEEREMFPRARKLLSAAALLDLGKNMQARKRELLADRAGANLVTRAADKLIVATVAAVLPRGDEAQARS